MRDHGFHVLQPGSMMTEEIGAWKGELGWEYGAGEELCHCIELARAIYDPLFIRDEAVESWLAEDEICVCSMVM